MKRRERVLASEGNGNIPRITADDNGETYRAAVVVPILAAGDAIGAVILVSRDADAQMSTTELKVCETAANFMGKQMEN